MGNRVYLDNIRFTYDPGRIAPETVRDKVIAALWNIEGIDTLVVSGKEV